MKRIISWSVPALVVLAAVFTSGCRDEAQPYALVVECDNDVARKSVDVDIIGVTQLEKGEWEAYPVNKYWEGDDPKRKSADKLTLQFGIGHTNRYVLSPKDPKLKQKWLEWMNRRVTDVAIIAHLRSITTEGRGNEDPRRKILPLKEKVVKEIWPGAKAFRIYIQDAGIRIDPLEKAPVMPKPAKAAPDTKK